ncbi:LuxR C-terminal-related transcriptional regulator [Streptomyces sp. NPDC048514]|uniref:LuxR C-terminal-related transcriptional regulator n=1 Tax=Streptomyces sp. NPDC048514 TaxID=3365564 RepID=UPI00371177D0
MGVQQRSARWPLAGRDDERAAFAAVWAQRRCEVVVICGPAGVGKSRFAEECLAGAAQEGSPVATAAATESAATVPLGAIAHLMPAEVDLSDPVKGFAAVAEALAARSGRPRRSVLWVDDLHLLDPASAVLLRQLMDAGVIRLIGTVRTGVSATEAVEVLVRGDTVHRIDLGPFRQEQTQEVLRAALGGLVGRRSLHELHSASGGNALHLRELVDSALQAGTLAGDGGVWELAEGWVAGSPRLTQLIADRLDAADTRARPVLELLAVCDPVSLADAQQLVSLEVLSGLEDAGMIRLVADRGRHAVQFAHPLYGECLRADIPGGRRRALLLRQAERTRAHGARRRDDALHIATWCLAATGSADPATLLEAAVLARHANDYSQAATLSRAAWREARTAQAALSYATALIGLARHDDADRVLREAEDVVLEADRPAVREARVNNVVLQGRLLEARRLLRDRHDTRSRLSLATVLYFRGRFRECVEFCRPLLDSDDAVTAMDAAIFGASALLRLALVDDAAEVLEPLRSSLPGPGRPGGARNISLYSDYIEDVDAYAHALKGDLRTAEAILARQYRQAVARKQASVAARRAIGLGFVLMERGKPRSALSVLHSVATGTDHWELFTQWAQAGATTCAAVLRQGAAADMYAGLLPPVGDDIEACDNRIARAWHAHQRNDLPETERLLIEAAERAAELGQTLHRIWVVHDMGRLGMAGLAAPYWDVTVPGDYLRARLDYTRALALDDARLLARVAEVFHEAGAGLFAAEAFGELARLHDRGGRPRQATAAASRARDSASRCEGARTPALADLSAARADAVPLTAREREIARLAARGAANKDIADALHLSPRTVENHLQRAYTKLGVTTRGELADLLDR